MLAKSGKSGFNRNIAQQIRLFLERQQQPICFVAHNGPEFDFPILARNPYAVGGELPRHINLKCGDSLRAFRDFKPIPSGAGRQGQYRLVTLYCDAFDVAPPDEHSAERDSIALMKIVIHAGTGMITWFERNSVKNLTEFKDVKVVKRVPKPRSSRGGRR